MLRYPDVYKKHPVQSHTAVVMCKNSYILRLELILNSTILSYISLIFSFQILINCLTNIVLTREI